MIQLPLFAAADVPAASAAPQPMEPTIWVRRIRILRELRTGPDHIIRDVELRRGLNVVWAPPRAVHADMLGGSGIAGHTAGKTAFCRLVRYALGEHHFANEATTQRIRAKLPAAWLLAEVIVAGRVWAIARPLGLGRRPFCLRDGSVEEIVESGDRSDYGKFQDAVASATTARLPATRLPGRDDAISWAHLLPWLTRDQECRFSEFLEWRHPSSASNAPTLLAEERHFLVRSVLGLTSDAERSEQQRNADLVARKEQQAKRLPELDRLAQVDAARLARRLLGQHDIGPGLFLEPARAELTRRGAALAEGRARLAAHDRRGIARDALEQAVAAETNALRDLGAVGAKLEDARGMLVQLEPRERGHEQEALIAALLPPRGYCAVPMSEARERRCPIAATRGPDLRARIGDRAWEEHRAEQARQIDVLEQQRHAAVLAHEAAVARAVDARRQLLRAQSEFDIALTQLTEQVAELRELEHLAEHAERSERKAAASRDRVSRLMAEIKQSYTRQDELRRPHQSAFERVSAAFEHIARALLGEDISASVEASGRSIVLHVDRDGERDSAAVSTVKLLAFDLAAMTTSIEGNGYFPRFLLHDGPREADLAADIYDRLFLYAQELERRFVSEPGFQYIVTTTTEPPAAAARDPWLRLRLSGASSDERLYRVDF